MRRELLLAMFSNTTWAFRDQTGKGALSVKPLANGDSDLYNPLFGEEDLTTDNHYYGLNYLSAAIDATNNPVTTIVEDLEEHFGGTDLYGANVVVWFNKAQTPIMKTLPGFNNQGLSRYETTAQGESVLIGVPTGVPGKLIGWAGAWLYEWPWIPANYLWGMDLDAPKPLRMRVDPENVGLGAGALQLVAQQEVHPFKGSFYSQRYGFGVVNRLNGVIAQLVASINYTIPAAYVR